MQSDSKTDDEKINCQSSDSEYTTRDMIFTVYYTLHERTGYSAAVNTQKYITPNPILNAPLCPRMCMYDEIVHFTTHICWLFCGRWHTIKLSLFWCKIHLHIHPYARDMRLTLYYTMHKPAGYSAAIDTKKHVYPPRFWIHL